MKSAMWAIAHMNLPGRFSGGRGQFFGSDTFKGEPVRLRFEWSGIRARSARWEQAFSYDGGRTWDPPNWIMELQPYMKNHKVFICPSARPSTYPKSAPWGPPRLRSARM